MTFWTTTVTEQRLTFKSEKSVTYLGTVNPYCLIKRYVVILIQKRMLCSMCECSCPTKEHVLFGRRIGLCGISFELYLMLMQLELPIDLTKSTMSQFIWGNLWPMFQFESSFENCFMMSHISKGKIIESHSKCCSLVTCFHMWQVNMSIFSIWLCHVIRLQHLLWFSIVHPKCSTLWLNFKTITQTKTHITTWTKSVEVHRHSLTWIWL